MKHHTIQTAIALALLASSAVHAQDAVQWKVANGGNGHWYTWRPCVTGVDASVKATELHGDLVSIASVEENEYARQILAESGRTFAMLGYIQADNQPGPEIGWAWSSGQPTTFTNWTDFDGGYGFVAPDDRPCAGATAAEDNQCNQCIMYPDGRWDDIERGPSCGGFASSSVAIIEWSADCNNDGIVDYGQCRDGTLPDYNGNSVPDSCEVPSGWIVVADSAADYATTQGVKGWHYLFDNGVGTPVIPMAYVVTSEFPPFMPAWCTRPNFGGGGSYCSIDRIQCHTSTPSNCSSASAGLERPHRRWINSSEVKGAVLISGYFGATAGFTTRLQLFADGALVFEQVNSAGSTTGNLTPIGAVVDIPPTSVLDVVIDPNDGSCHADRVEYSIRLIGADCNSDGVVDFGQILTGQLSDANGDGIPDVCQQPTCHAADLFVNGIINGADLGILLSEWGPITSLTPSDINGDNVVNGADLGILLSFWGSCR
jgi:hypothetical protein